MDFLLIYYGINPVLLWGTVRHNEEYLYYANRLCVFPKVHEGQSLEGSSAFRVLHYDLFVQQ